MYLLLGILSIVLASCIYYKSNWFVTPSNPFDIVGYLRVLSHCKIEKKIKHYVMTLVIFLLVLVSAFSIWIELFVIQPLLN